MKITIAFFLALSCFGQTPSILNNVQQINWGGQAPPAVSQVSAQVIGASGPSTFYYWVIAKAASGNATPSQPLLVSNGPLALSSSNYIKVSWTATSNAASYDLLRTTTPNLPLAAASIAVTTSLSATTFNDQGGSLTSYTVNTQPPTGPCNWQLDSDSQLIHLPCVTLGPGTTHNIIAGTGINFTGPGSSGLNAILGTGDLTVNSTVSGGSPAAPRYSVQTNDPLGTFAGSANLTYNAGSDGILQVTNNGTSNTTLESGNLLSSLNANTLAYLGGFTTTSQNIFVNSKSGSSLNALSASDVGLFGIYAVHDGAGSAIEADVLLDGSGPTNAQAFTSYCELQNPALTNTECDGYFALDNNIKGGSGATLNTSVAFYANDMTHGTTDNFGFETQQGVHTSLDRSFYAAGLAPSEFLGAVKFGQITDGSAATPVIQLDHGKFQVWTLNQNITSFTISGQTKSSEYCFDFIQDATGGWTIAGVPAAIHGFFTIGTTALSHNVQCFFSPDGTNLYAESTGVINQ